jgi:hypothetical protein
LERLEEYQGVNKAKKKSWKMGGNDQFVYFSLYIPSYEIGDRHFSKKASLCVLGEEEKKRNGIRYHSGRYSNALFSNISPEKRLKRERPKKQKTKQNANNALIMSGRRKS